MYNALTVDLRRCISSVLPEVAAYVALMVYSKSNCHLRRFVASHMGINQYIIGVVTLAHLNIKITLNVDKIVTYTMY